MSTLKDYLSLQERVSAAPVTGDEFDFHVNETLSIETSVLEHDDESFTIDLDETAYSYLEQMGFIEHDIVEQLIVEDDSVFNYAVEYHLAGSDDNATKALRIIPVEDPGRGPLYPEYVRTKLNSHSINKEMKEKGYRPHTTRGVWKGNIDKEIADAKEKLSMNLTDTFRREFSKKAEDLEFVKRHMDGKPYKTSFGRETTEDIEEAGFMDKVKGALGMGQKATPAATPAAVPAALAPKGATVMYNGEKFEKAYDGAWESSTFTAHPKSFPDEWKAIEAAYAKSGAAPTEVDPYIGGHSFARLDRMVTRDKAYQTLTQSKSTFNHFSTKFNNGKYYEVGTITGGGYQVYRVSPVQQPGYFTTDPRTNKSIFKSLGEGVNEAEYQGREVKLGKPMKGDVRKYKVYVKNPKTGNIKKVNFGDPNMEIRRDDPARRKNFRARHGCGTPRASDRTKAAYWSCRMWSSKPVSSILKGK